MTGEKVVLSSRVRLARNYEDLPFNTAASPKEADECVNRTARALAHSGEDRGYTLIRLADLSDVQRRALAESHLISRDLLRAPETAAVLLNEVETVSVMMNEEDHLRIQAVCPGLEIAEAARRCFRVDDALSRQTSFAFDEQLGYLTACPTNTGTGMRASLLMHLPMLTAYKQMGNVGQIVAKVGLTIRGVYGEGAEALGQIYQVSNQVTLGRTEEEIASAVTTVGHQLMDMELALREKALKDDRLDVEDKVFRAWGILRSARRMGMEECFQHWSQVRLGAALGLLNADMETLDALLEQAQDAHLRAFAEHPLDARGLEETRAARIRGMLDGKDSLKA